jgi:hypothetical protein
VTGPRNFLRLVDNAAVLGVTKQRAHQLARSQGFPRPAGSYERGALWAKVDVLRWAKGYRGGAKRWGHPAVRGKRL